jgi:D-tyrosyl-tRNA(Tyr) deacylase
MIGLIQRVTHANVCVEQQTIAEIKKGVLLLLGVEKGDTQQHIVKLAKKVAQLRIFEDAQDKMNNSLIDIDGELLVVSQFTLVADTNKGNRPGFSNAAPPHEGKQLYEDFIAHYKAMYGKCQHGQFGATMQVTLVNDGPATFHLKV